MSNDRTRVMRNDNGGNRGKGRPVGPEDQQRHMRYLVIALLAVIAGLIIAVIVISRDDSSSTEQTGTTDIPAVIDNTTDEAPVAPTGDSGPTGDTATPDNSGGVSPEPAPDTGGGSGGVSPDSGGVSPGSPDSSSGSGNSGGIGP